MRKRFIPHALIVTVCCLAAMLATIIYLKQSSNAICQATRECPVQAESAGGEMLWESLSRQFVSSVHF